MFSYSVFIGRNLEITMIVFRDGGTRRGHLLLAREYLTSLGLDGETHVTEFKRDTRYMKDD
jgi:hypothetical protein